MRIAAILVLLCLTACSGKGSSSNAEGTPDATKVDNPFRGVMQDRSFRSPDEALFVQKCSMCHRQMGMGTVILARRMPPDKAMLEQRDDLSADLVQAAVRQGIGNMPRIGRGEVSDEQLGRIATYLAKGKAP